MSGPGQRPARTGCARCSNDAVVLLACDAVEDPAAMYPVHHTTTLAVCDEHVDAAVRSILDALNARPTRPAPPTPPPPASIDRGAPAHFRDLAAVFRLAADMLDPDSSWPADEVEVVQARLRRLADNAPTIGRRRG